MQFAFRADDVTSRRLQKKIQISRDIEAAAWGRFKKHGYDATTVDQIVQDVGISQRTFFRYFESKEAVLFGDWSMQIEDITRRIAKADAMLPPLRAVQTAIMSLAHAVEANREAVILRSTLAATSPGARSYYRQSILPAWENAIAKALAERLGVDIDTDLRPKTIAGAALAALNAANDVWTTGGCVALLTDLTDQAFAVLLDSRGAVS